MARYGNTLWCDGCGIEIQWVPRVHDQLIYCCEDCLNGVECSCDENEAEENLSWLENVQSYPQETDY